MRYQSVIVAVFACVLSFALPVMAPQGFVSTAQAQAIGRIIVEGNQRIEAETFRSFEVYFTLTGIYLVISLVTMWLLAAIGRRAFSYPQR